MSEQLTAEHFLPHVDRIFRVTGGRHGLVLKKVELGPPEPDPAVRRSFTLIFTGPPGDVLPEGLYGFDDVVGPNSLEAHISRLRRKLEAAGASIHIHTLRGIGYLAGEHDERP